MSGIVNQISNLFFPPAPPEKSEVTFKMAIDAITTQRIARITKIALYTLASIAATVTFVLTEASVISWMFALPALAVALVSGLIFYRLHSLDSEYVNMLDDKTRESLAKNELERLFLNEKRPDAEELEKSLKGINRLLQLEIFSEKSIYEILAIMKDANGEGSAKSLGEFASENNKPILISATSVWTDRGYFGQPNYEKSVTAEWSGHPADPISISYQAKMKDAKGNDVVQEAQ